MILKLVNRPLQDQYTELEDVQYDTNEHWCVETYFYREADGGLKLFFEKLQRIKPDIIYLFEIKAWKNKKIVIGTDESNWEEDIIYSVRCDLQN